MVSKFPTAIPMGGAVQDVQFVITNKVTGEVRHEEGRLLAVPIEFGKSFVLFQLRSFTRDLESDSFVGNDPLIEGTFSIRFKMLPGGKRGAVKTSVDDIIMSHSGSSACRLTEGEFRAAVVAIVNSFGDAKWLSTWCVLPEKSGT